MKSIKVDLELEKTWFPYRSICVIIMRTGWILISHLTFKTRPLLQHCSLKQENDVILICIEVECACSCITTNRQSVTDVSTAKEIIQRKGTVVMCTDVQEYGN